MSNAALQGGASGTGTVTLLAPNTSTDRTLTLPDATGTILAGSLESNMTSAFSFRNKIINGRVEIWQRGTSFASASDTFTADRWVMNNTACDIASGGTAPSYTIKATTTSATNTCNLSQCLEQSTARTLWGKNATLSAKAYCSTGTVTGYLIIYKNSTANTRSGGAWNQIATQAITITTTPTQFTTSVAIPSDTTAEGIKVTLYFNNIANGVSVHWYEIQLEEGSVATPFETRPYGVELALCQRYYYRNTPGALNARFSMGQALSATSVVALTTFPVRMRVAPSALEQTGVAGDYGSTSASGSAVACSAVPTFGTATTECATSVFTATTGWAAGSATQPYAVATTAYLGWSAEL